MNARVAYRSPIFMEKPMNSSLPLIPHVLWVVFSSGWGFVALVISGAGAFVLKTAVRRLSTPLIMGAFLFASAPMSNVLGQLQSQKLLPTDTHAWLPIVMAAASVPFLLVLGLLLVFNPLPKAD